MIVDYNNALQRIRNSLDEVLYDARYRNEHVAIVSGEIADTGRDNFGHVVLVVDHLLEGMKKKGDRIYWTSPTEFFGIYGAIKDPKDIALAVGKVMNAIGSTMGLAYHLGVASNPCDADGVDRLLYLADHAKLESKTNGQHFTLTSDPLQGRPNLTDLLKIAQVLPEVIRTGSFPILYQPKIRMSDMKINGYEVLSRLRMPGFPGLVSPTVFIPMAERLGLINDLGNSVLRRSLRQTAEWRKKYGADLTVAVNVSPFTLRDRGAGDRIANTIDGSKLHPSNVIVEFTECAGYVNHDDLITASEIILSSGSRVAIDDLLTESSALDLIRRLRAGVVKLDYGLVSKMEPGNADTAIAQAVVSMVHDLPEIDGRKRIVVAEGAHRDTNLDLLRAMQVDEVQGFSFAPPTTADDMEIMLAAQKTLFTYVN